MACSGDAAYIPRMPSRRRPHYTVEAYRREGDRDVLITSAVIVASGDDQAEQEAGFVQSQYPTATLVVRDRNRLICRILPRDIDA
jgi:hypothetical protein